MCMSITVAYFMLYCAANIPHTNQEPPAPEQSCYLPSSLACKMWNYTSMDCSWRSLVCIPFFKHAEAIQFLDLSRNNFRILPDYAFSQVPLLLHLDLSYCDITKLVDGAFSGLHELLTLNLQFNLLTLIQSDVFVSLHKLQWMDLSYNHISQIDDGAFNGLRNMLSLDVTKNNVSYVSDETFTMLSNLTNLNLTGNFLSTSPGFPFQNLTSLQSLHLTWLDLPSLCTTSFIGLENLQVLKMNFGYWQDNITGFPLAPLSSLRELHIYQPISGVFGLDDVDYPYIYDCDNIWKLFIGLHNLQYLEIRVGGHCPVIEFCSSYEQHPNNLYEGHQCTDVILLTHLQYHKDPNSNGLPSFSELSNLTKLELHFEEDLYISEEFYPSMPLANWTMSLQELKLIASDYAIQLEGTPFKWFSNLKVLHIVSGDLVLMENAFEGLHTLITLKVGLHMFPVFTKSLFVVDDSYNELQGGFELIWKQLCKLPLLQNIHFSHLLDNRPMHWSCSPPNLKVLNIQNQIGKVFRIDVCLVAPHLESLDLSGNYITYDQTNCTCSNLVALMLNKSRVSSSTWSTANRMYLPVLHELYLNGCGPLAKVIVNFIVAPQLQYLDFSYNDIVSINNELGSFFSNLMHLDLRNNKLEQLDDVIAYFSNLEYLDLQYNKLTSVNSFGPLKNIRTLSLQFNDIAIVPKSLLSQTHHPYLTTLSLGSNQFQCDCHVESFRHWILIDLLVYLTSGPEYYTCSSPESTIDVSITEVSLDCESHLLTYILSALICLAFVLIVVAAIVHYWWHIQYRLFLLVNQRRNQQHNLAVDDDDFELIDDNEQGLPRYDAYVPYHIDDEDWVDEELLRNIERGEERFRVCLRRRDIRAGRPIFGEISLHMQRSRKILAILSPQFVEDNWCYFELNKAHHRVLEEGRNVMIFIILEEIPNNKMTLLLRQLFCRVQCLRWPGDGYGQDLFWRRLREELKRPVPLDRRFNV